MSKIKFEITYDTDTQQVEVINAHKIVTTTVKKTSSSKGPIEDGGDTPTIFMVENKYVFNKAAIDLTGFVPGDRVDIKYEKKNDQFLPIIATDEIYGTKGGNRITQTYSVSCRGRARAKLMEYGDTFTLAKHPDKDGIFVLTGNKEPIKEEVSEVEIPEDSGIDELIDDPDAKEITDFNFNLVK